MTFPDITSDLKEKLPDLRGRMTANAPLSAITWFRVGGPA
ncbi:MAG: UDP-N-acetylmuramate dehydrogenase, partial [Alphaproteobacteria bacterium]